MDCCHVALFLTKLAIFLATTNIITLAIFAGYTVKLRTRQMILERRNGREQREIDQLKKEIEKLKGGKHD